MPAEVPGVAHGIEKQIEFSKQNYKGVEFFATKSDF